jgi:hypothetical protein
MALRILSKDVQSTSFATSESDEALRDRRATAISMKSS